MMTKLDLRDLLLSQREKITDLIDVIKTNDSENIIRSIRQRRCRKNLKSNQDLIDQMENYKADSLQEIDQLNAIINGCYTAIDNYEESINSLNDAITTFEAQITEVETEIANDDLIIAYIPPDISK